MLIATRDFEISDIVNLASNYDALCNYIRELVPREYRHIEAIYHNTRYYINLQVLKDNKRPMEKKMELSKNLTTNMRVVGFMGKYITCDDLEAHIDMRRVKRYYEGDNHG